MCNNKKKNIVGFLKGDNITKYLIELIGDDNYFIKSEVEGLYFTMKGSMIKITELNEVMPCIIEIIKDCDDLSIERIEDIKYENEIAVTNDEDKDDNELNNEEKTYPNYINKIEIDNKNPFTFFIFYNENHGRNAIITTNENNPFFFSKNLRSKTVDNVKKVGLRILTLDGSNDWFMYIDDNKDLSSDQKVRVVSLNHDNSKPFTTEYMEVNDFYYKVVDEMEARG